MLRRLRAIRFTWTQIAIVAAASVAASAVIIASSRSGDGLTYSTLAALREHVAVRTTPSATAAPSTTPPAAPPNSPGDTVGDSTSVAPLASSTPTSTGPDTSATTNDNGGSDPSGTSGSETTGSAGTSPSTTPSATARHVFVIALTTPSYRAAFGSGSVARYLNRTLRRNGVLLSGYRTLGGSELPDYLAMVSGQAPNADTRGDCTTYSEFADSAKASSNGQMLGPGCIYPNTVLTIGDQVTAAGKQWKAYLADMGTSSCMHPNSGAAADGPLAGVGAQYDVVHNPFIYFHSLLDLGGCSSNDVGLQHLSGDLRTAKRTPTYSFIAPGGCDEPVPASCPAGKTGLAAEDAFLKRWVPAITASAGYHDHGVLMIVFTHAPAEAPGWVRTGALILAPGIQAGRALAGAYTPYSVLRSTEDLLGYTPLVHAKAARSFAAAALTSG